MVQFQAMRQHIDNLSVDLASNEGGSCDQVSDPRQSHRLRGENCQAGYQKGKHLNQFPR